MSDAAAPANIPPAAPHLLETAAASAPPPAPPFVPTRPPRLWRIRRFARSLNPLRLFFGPVFQREIRVTGRRRGTYVIRLLVLFVPTAFVALNFAVGSMDARMGYAQSVAGAIQSLQGVAFSVAATVAWCQLITLSMIAPLLTAGALVEERTARTLSAIAASPLTPGAVIGGVFASRMVNLAILALLPLPLILAIRTFGGLETSFVLWSFAIAVSSAVAAAALGLWSSTRATRTATAVSTTVMLMLLQWIGPVLIFMAEAALKGWRGPGSFEWMIVSPIATLAIVQNAPPGSVFGFSGAEIAATNCAISLGIAFVALLLARWQLARLIATDRVELVRQPSRRERRRARAAAAQAGAPAIEGAPEPSFNDAGSSRTVEGNPVLWREVRQPLFNAAWKRWLGVIGVVLLVLVIHASTLTLSRMDSEAVVIAPAIVTLIVLILSAAAVPAGSVTTEREAQTWATLLTTPLSPLQILVPKVAGAVRRLWPPFLFITLHMLLCVVRGVLSPIAVPFVLLHFVVYAVFLSATGVFFSLCCRKTVAAATLNLLLALALWMLAPIFASILAALAGVSRGDSVIGYTFFANPVVTCVAGLVGLTDRNQGFDMPGPGRMSAEVFTVLWLVSLAAYTGLAALVLLYARSAFHRLSTARI